jgi:hypothetical protein
MGATPLWGPEVRDDVDMWQDNAACKGADPVLFELLNEDHPASEALNRTDMFHQNVENFEDAATYCERCPVLAECLASASDDDLDWTVRGGRTPRKFTGLPVGRPRKHNPNSGKRNKIVNGKKRCSKGHEYDVNAARCPQCRATYKKWYLREVRLKAGKKDYTGMSG